MKSRNVVLVVLGVVIVAALVGAAAALAGEWKIEGKSLTELGVKEEATKQVGGALHLESKIAETPLALGCESSESVEGTGKIQQEGKDEHTLTFSKCSVAAPATCGVAEPIKTKALKSELLKVGEIAYDNLTPVSGTVLAQITLTGGGCAFAGTYNVTGSFPAEVGQEATKLHLVFAPEVSEEAGTGAVKLGANPASLEGEVNLSLNGANKGKRAGAANADVWIKSSANPLSFGEVVVNAEKTETVTITYNRLLPMRTSMVVAVTNVGAAVFTEVAGGTCSGKRLKQNAAENTCTVKVKFKPTSKKLFEGHIELTEPRILWFFQRELSVPIEGTGK